MQRLASPLLLALVIGSTGSSAARGQAGADAGTPATDSQGRPLNLDFESGSLSDWTATGEAFARQPIRGDTVHPRRADMHSRHQGEYWIGSFELAGDKPRGTLTSKPFRVTHPYASFLVAGGNHATTRVEIVREDTGRAVFQASGDETEELKRAVADLRDLKDKSIFIRVVDDHSGHWGHVNFDDFRFHASKPVVPNRPQALAPDVIAHAGLSPDDAAKAMTVPPGFEVTLFAGEPDVVQPIAMSIDDRGRLWVAEAYSYPRRVAPDQAKDRILIFEDTDNDGRFDSRKVFIDKLNLVSGIELGFGGVWVGASPEFLFIPDKDGDDRPDGPPQVLLDGWGQQDTHETANSFIWGPDGWLYGCHGVFTHSLVSKPGTTDDQRVPLNAGIWRYHPTKHRFEVFAHGTSNPWGVNFDARGQAFLTSCVIPHLYHVIQGGRYERQAGPHFNPYTYDDIKTIADHRHYVGTNPHAGNERSDSAGGGHAHAGAMIYLGDAWPAEYRGSILMNNIHGARLNRDVLTPDGSGFVGGHKPDFLLSNDRWSQLLYFRSGPDGNVYMIDWYDKNQCHRNENEMHDRTNGRIFKVSYGDAKPRPVDLRALADDQLAGLLLNANDWHCRQARRILQERGPNPALSAKLGEIAFGHDDEARRLRGLWALHATGNLDEAAVAKGLNDAGPHMRAWTIQLSSEEGKPSSATLAKLAALAKSDPSPVVRLYLASASQKLPPEQRWNILEGLVQHAEDADDHNLPLMDWYAAEPLATLDAPRALRLASSARIPRLRSFMVRRIAAIGTPESIALLIDDLGRADSSEGRQIALDGLNEALKGRRQVGTPEAWPEVSRRLLRDADPRVRSAATALGVTFGDASALESMRTILSDETAGADARREALASLLKARDPKLASTLHALLAEPDLRAALRGLAAFDDPATPASILKSYRDLSPPERRDALNTLASRVNYARALVDAVGAKTVPADDLSADLVRQLRNLKDADLDARIAKFWGMARDPSADAAKLIAQTKAVITRSYGPPRDLHLGRAVFAKTCAQCHTLFGAGAKVGPDLTGSNRADLDYILSNVLDPHSLIGKDYQAHVVATTDGRILTGLVRGEDKDAITLITANETLTLPKSDIEDRRPSDQSMMPDDLLKPLSEPEIRGLIAYLASPAQVPMLATPDNAASFFNGKDLTGWVGDPSLWSVQDGEIVGRTSGLKKNEFLRGEMLAGDFRLSLQVKLVADEGNSGIQFRSESLPDGDIRGYQADAGPGWWGKLYEEHGRELLWDKSGEPHVKPGDWNTYIIEARGDHIRTTINGKPCVDLDDPKGAKRGIFALQLHSGGPTEVRFKDLKLELLK